MKTNIMGTAVATVQQMQSYIQKVNPEVPKSVIDMVEYYISEGKTEGVRGDIAFAQSCLETGNFTFNGSAVTLDQNNFAGIGVTKNGMKGNSFSHPWIGIRAQIQHLKAYASNEKLYGVCVDPRFCYVKREIAPYVEWLGIQENPQGGGWAAGKNYGSKILEILAKIIAMPEVNKEDVTMNLNTSLISNNNSYANQVPKYIVIHNTDNFAKGANAKAHAKAQHDGNFSGYSAHVYVDDAEAYQAKVEVEQIEWLLYPFIPYRKVTIIQGDPGEGKTTMVLQIIAKLTRGEAILPTVSLTDDKENAEVPVNVIYQTAEDGLGDTIKPRLLAAGADCSKVLVIDDTDQPLTMADIRLEEAIIQTKARMVVLDPITEIIYV